MKLNYTYTPYTYYPEEAENKLINKSKQVKNYVQEKAYQ